MDEHAPFATRAAARGVFWWFGVLGGRAGVGACHRLQVHRWSVYWGFSALRRRPVRAAWYCAWSRLQQAQGGPLVTHSLGALAAATIGTPSSLLFILLLLFLLPSHGGRPDREGAEPWTLATTVLRGFPVFVCFGARSARNAEEAIMVVGGSSVRCLGRQAIPVGEKGKAFGHSVLSWSWSSLQQWGKVGWG